MAVSAVDIVNLAYSNIGHEANVVSISPPDTTAEASHAARFYPIARDVVLEAHAWGWATRRSQLSNVVNEFAHWQFAYSAPNNMIRPLAIYLPSEFDDTKTQPFEMASDSAGNVVLLTNIEDAVVKYVHRVTDTARFTPQFVVSLSWLLSSFLAGPVAKKPELAAGARQAYGQALLLAKAYDSMSRKTDAYDKHVPSQIAARGGL